jgi:hypothetical protein
MHTEERKLDVENMLISVSGAKVKTIHSNHTEMLLKKIKIAVSIRASVSRVVTVVCGGGWELVSDRTVSHWNYELDWTVGE